MRIFSAGTFFGALIFFWLCFASGVAYAKEAVSTQENGQVQEVAPEVKTSEVTSQETTQTESNVQEAKKEQCFIVRLMNAGYGPYRRQLTDTVVLHSIFDAHGGDPYSVEHIIAVLQKKRVSAHYLIARDGCIYQLVDPERISYHAGVSRMPDGREHVNRFSLGIEIINGYDDFPTEEQYQALEWLLQDIRKRYPILFVVAHGEIAGRRRDDPWNLDWQRVQNFSKPAL